MVIYYISIEEEKILKSGQLQPEYRLVAFRPFLEISKVLGRSFHIEDILARRRKLSQKNDDGFYVIADIAIAKYVDSLPKRDIDWKVKNK